MKLSQETVICPKQNDSICHTLLNESIRHKTPYCSNDTVVTPYYFQYSSEKGERKLQILDYIYICVCVCLCVCFSVAWK